MSVVAIRKSAWVAGNDAQRTILRRVAEHLDLGEPAEGKVGNIRWLLSCDTRFTLRDAAMLSTVAAGLNDHRNYRPPIVEDRDEAGNVVASRVDGAAVRRDVANYVRTRMVWPVDVPEGADPWATVMTANGAPNWLRFGDGVPENWVPVEVGS